MSWKDSIKTVDEKPSSSWRDTIISEEEKASPVMSGVRNLAQGAAGGFSDELAGLVEGAGRVVGVEGAGGPMKDIKLSDDGATLDWEILKDAYKRARDKERSSLKKDEKDNPGVSATANLAGSIVSPLNKIANGMTLAKSGAVLGGINALGASDAEDVSGMAVDTGAGALGGALIGKGVEVASPYIAQGANWVGGKMREGAKSLAARALGAERGTIKSMGIDKVKDAGAYALDNGLFTPLASTDDIIARNNALKDKGGKMMGDAYQAIDDAGASTFNPLEAAVDVEKKIGDFYRSPINRGETNQLENTLESILMRGDQNLPLSEAQALKEELGKVANWKNKLSITDKEKMARDAYGVISQHIDDAVAKGAEAVDQAGLSEALAKGKDLFSKASSAGQLLENRLAREQGNKFIGLTDAITGGAALGYGGTAAVPTIAMLGAKKGLEKYGAQNAAMGMNKVAKALMKSPQFANLAAKNPAAFQNIVTQFESKLGAFENSLPRAADDQSNNFNESLGKDALLQRTSGTKYGQVLQSAAQKGDQSFAAAHFVLANRDPEYRKTVGRGR